MSVERDDFKRDLMTAFSLLEDELTDAEAWELYARIAVLGEFEQALLQMQERATALRATLVIELLANLASRRRIGGAGT